MSETIQQDIFGYVTQQENNYIMPIWIENNWEWNMKDHITLSVLYKNSQYSTGNKDDKPFKNITRPILNLQYRAEGFDVKDIVLYVDDIKQNYKSFLIKKYHDDKYVRQNNIDTFIDNLVETYVDFGGALVKNVNKETPEVVPWQSIDFVDQTDVMSGVIGIKHNLNPSQLKEMEKVGWGNPKNGATATIDEIIQASDFFKVQDKEDGIQNTTPGKYGEIIEVHGAMPESYLKEGGDETKMVEQMQIITFLTVEGGEKKGVTLFKGESDGLSETFKLVLRDEIYGRALGLGGAEELFEPQVWTNYSVIRMKEMLDSAAKTILKTTDPAVAARHSSGLKELDNLEIIELEEGKDIGQLDTFPRNIQLFERSVQEWEQNAQNIASAQDPLLGKEPPSGTPFRLEERIVQEGKGIHEYRQGKLSTFVEEIYREWTIPFISKEITKDHEWLSELDLKEMQEVGNQIAENVTNRMVVEKTLNGELITKEETEAFKELELETFRKSNKKFLKILKGEMKDAPVSVKVNIVNKQKDLQLVVTKLGNVFRTVLQSPQVLENPQMADLFNQIIESSGLNPIDFSGFKIEQAEAVPAGGGTPLPAEQPVV